MNLEFVEQVGRDNPTLLPTNLGRTCYRHTEILIERLRAAGHDAFFVCKSPGEGQYTPPGFRSRVVTGLDGRLYQCSGVSHDAIWFNGEQFDTIGSANEHDRPIYRRQGDPNWSFDPNDGPQIQAVARWDKIPRDKWRNNNPPLTDLVAHPIPAPGPEPLPPMPAPRPALEFPPRDLVGHAFENINDRYRRGGRPQRIREELIANGDAPLYVDNEGLFVWLPQYLGHYARSTEADVRDRHTAALKATLSDLEAAWPK